MPFCWLAGIMFGRAGGAGPQSIAPANAALFEERLKRYRVIKMKGP